MGEVRTGPGPKAEGIRPPRVEGGLGKIGGGERPGPAFAARLDTMPTGRALREVAGRPPLPDKLLITPDHIASGKPLDVAAGAAPPLKGEGAPQSVRTGAEVTGPMTASGSPERPDRTTLPGIKVEVGTIPHVTAETAGPQQGENNQDAPENRSRWGKRVDKAKEKGRNVRQQARNRMPFGRRQEGSQQPGGQAEANGERNAGGKAEGQQPGQQKSGPEAQAQQPGRPTEQAQAGIIPEAQAQQQPGEAGKGAEDPAKKQRIQDLEQKVRDGKASGDEIKELQGLKQDPEQRRQELTQKALDGNIRPEEADELGRLNEAKTEKPQTPEAAREKLKNDMDALGNEIAQKLINGELPSAEDLKRMQELRGRHELMKAGFTQEDAKAAVMQALNGEHSGKRGEKQVRSMEAVKKQMQELMSIEMQIQTIPKTIDALRAQRKLIKKEANKAHKDAKGKTGEARLQAKQEEYAKYMQLANINARIIQTRYEVPILNARRHVLEASVRRRLGATGPLMSVVEWAGAATNSAVVNVGVNISEELDYRTGNF